MSVSNTTKRVKEIRRKTRRKFSSEEKSQVLVRGKDPHRAGRVAGRVLNCGAVSPRRHQCQLVLPLEQGLS